MLRALHASATGQRELGSPRSHLPVLPVAQQGL